MVYVNLSRLLLIDLDVGELPGEDVRFPVLVIQCVLSDGVFCVFLVLTIFNGFSSEFEPLCMLLVAKDCLLIGVIILGGIAPRCYLRYQGRVRARCLEPYA